MKKENTLKNLDSKTFTNKSTVVLDDIRKKGNLKGILNYFSSLEFYYSCQCEIDEIKEVKNLVKITSDIIEEKITTAIKKDGLFNVLSLFNEYSVLKSDKSNQKIMIAPSFSLSYNKTEKKATFKSTNKKIAFSDINKMLELAINPAESEKLKAVNNDISSFITTLKATTKHAKISDIIVKDASLTRDNIKACIVAEFKKQTNGEISSIIGIKKQYAKIINAIIDLFNIDNSIEINEKFWHKYISKSLIDLIYIAPIRDVNQGYFINDKKIVTNFSDLIVTSISEFITKNSVEAEEKTTTEKKTTEKKTTEKKTTEKKKVKA